MAAAAFIALGASDIGRITAGQRIARQAAAECETKGNKENCQSSLASVRSAIASEDAVNLAIWQTVINTLGLAGLFLTVFYAAKAWQESKRSADADNAALAITTTGMAEARKDAAEQAKRFTEQLALSQETMEYTARSSRAMETSATATRRMASTTGSAAKDQLRPYVYLVDERCDLELSLGVIYSADATFGFKNFGQTPAKNVRFRAAFNLRVGPWNQDFTPDLTPIYELHFGDLPPGHLRHMLEGYKAPALEQYQLALRDDGVALVLYGEVLYEDAAGGKYRTTFRRAANGPYGQTYTFHIPPNGNEAT